MEDVARIEKSCSRFPGVEHVLCTTGAGFLGTINISSVFVRLADIEDRAFSPTPVAQDLEVNRWRFRGVYSQRDVMQGVRARMKQFHRSARAGANSMALNQGSAVDIDFPSAGRTWALNRYSERLRAATHPGMVDVDTTAVEQTGIEGLIDRDRAATSASTHPISPIRCASWWAATTKSPVSATKNSPTTMMWKVQANRRRPP
jgi:hypothetical protein